MRDTYQLVHARSSHVLCDHDWSRDTMNGTKHLFTVLISDLWSEGRGERREYSMRLMRVREEKEGQGEERVGSGGMR